jgi:hypothetical protein
VIGIVAALALPLAALAVASPASGDPPLPPVHSCHAHAHSNGVSITWIGVREGTTCHAALHEIHDWAHTPYCLSNTYCLIRTGYWSCHRRIYSDHTRVSHCTGVYGHHGEFFYDWHHKR